MDLFSSVHFILGWFASHLHFSLDDSKYRIDDFMRWLLNSAWVDIVLFMFFISISWKETDWTRGECNSSNKHTAQNEDEFYNQKQQIEKLFWFFHTFFFSSFVRLFDSIRFYIKNTIRKCGSIDGTRHIWTKWNERIKHHCLIWMENKSRMRMHIYCGWTSISYGKRNANRLSVWINKFHIIPLYHNVLRECKLNINV